MTDHPIIFSAPMVRALLDGRKTQTRRIIKDRSVLPGFCGGKFDDKNDPEAWGWQNYDAGEWITLDQWRRYRFVPYAPGDRLWVREAWGLGLYDHGHCPRYKATMDYQCGDKIISDLEGPFSWKSPIHMPRRFSRLTLTVADVRVQRVQDISEADAVAEGCNGLGALMATEEFADLWNTFHGRGAWDRNEWVAALTFTVERRNIDA